MVERMHVVGLMYCIGKHGGAFLCVRGLYAYMYVGKAAISEAGPGFIKLWAHELKRFSH